MSTEGGRLMAATLFARPDGEGARMGATLYAACKRPLDVILALILLVVAAPVVVATMVLVKLTSRGPAIYHQTRLGRYGRPFTIYKIRTMAHDCERQSGPRWASAGDPRVTTLGRFLRASHLDELPQLWNVLRGDMSLVGPRPERPVFVAQLERALPGYGGRMAVRPGVTGLAQIQLPPDTDLGSVARKLQCDLAYVESFSFWMDFQILICTAAGMIGVPFSACRRLLGLPSVEAKGCAPEPELVPAEREEPIVSMKATAWLGRPS